jgi:Raf kinase inhibitor-like YbhB/YbcL family protein
MFTLTCSSYADGSAIPNRFADLDIPGGKNISPGFTWEDPPVSTKSFAISIVDPHPVARNWIHWLIIDIPFRERSLPEGASRSSALPPGSRELKNTSNTLGYAGPSPPKGTGAHPYVATLYALNVQMVNLPADTTLSQFLRAIEGKVIAEATMKGMFEVR